MLMLEEAEYVRERTYDPAAVGDTQVVGHSVAWRFRVCGEYVQKIYKLHRPIKGTGLKSRFKSVLRYCVLFRGNSIDIN